MAIVARKRADGGTTYTVRWRLRGAREGAWQSEKFAAHGDRVNRRNAEEFEKRVQLAGYQWPEGWIRGYGPVEVQLDSGRTVIDVGTEYARQLTDISPGQRKRYVGMLRTLATVTVERRGETVRPFLQDITQFSETDAKLWLNQWPRAWKTKSNYHGFLSGVFSYAVDQGLLKKHPLRRTAPKRAKIKASQAEMRCLSEDEYRTAQSLVRADYSKMMLTTVGTGLRFGEVSALWVEDVDFSASTIRVNKAWKREGEDGEHDTPAWLLRRLKSKHAMRQHYLGSPNSLASRRTIAVSPTVLEALREACEGKQPDDFVFTTTTGKPVHGSEFYDQVWLPLLGELTKVGIRRFRFHDLRHTHASWLIGGGAALPYVQNRMGHDDIGVTVGTYGHLMQHGVEQILKITEQALHGKISDLLEKSA